MMAFVGAVIIVSAVYVAAWQYDAKKCRDKGWEFNFSGQCYDKDGFLRKP